MHTFLADVSVNIREENMAPIYTRKALMRQLVDTAKWLASCQ